MISIDHWVLWVHILAMAAWLGGAAVTLVAVLPVDGPFRIAAARRAHFLTSRAMEVVVLTGLVNIVLKGHETGYALGRGFFAMLSLKMALLVAMAIFQIVMGLAWKRAQETDAPTRTARVGLAAQCLLGAVAVLLGIGLRAV